jgi:hypothetical protein
MNISLESRFSDVELFQMFDLDIGSCMIAQGHKANDPALVNKGQRVQSSLLVYRNRNRAGDNVQADAKTNYRKLMGHPGTFSIEIDKSGKGEHKVNMQKTGIGCDKAFRASRVASLAAAYAENTVSEVSPFDVGFADFGE